LLKNKSTAYLIKIDLISRKIILICSSLLVAYNITFIFVDNDRRMMHISLLFIAAILNIIILFVNKNIDRILLSAKLYIVINNFIFLPYVFIHGKGFEGFIPFFAIISCALPFYILKGKKGIASASMTGFIFLIMSLIYLFTKVEHIDKNVIYQGASFIISMVFIIIFSRLFTMLYLSSLKSLKDIATNDNLTKIKSRRYMIDEILIPREKVINKAGGVFSFALIDIDNFKEINDKYGHKYGDYTLQAIASVLTCLIRDTDEVARFGGDEFMVFFDNVGVKDAREVSKRIRTIISEIEIEGGVKTTISIGVVTVVIGHTKGYLRKADLCLMQAKAQGRNKLISYEIDYNKNGYDSKYM